MLSVSVKVLHDGSSLKMKRCPGHGFLVLLALFDGGSYGHRPNVGNLELGLPRMWSDNQSRLGLNFEGDRLMKTGTLMTSIIPSEVLLHTRRDSTRLSASCRP